MQTRTKFVDGRAEISLHGRFDFNAHRAFRNSCSAPLAASDVVELQLNLERVEHLDRSALGMLLLLKARAEEASKHIAPKRRHSRAEVGLKQPQSVENSHRTPRD